MSKIQQKLANKFYSNSKSQKAILVPKVFVGKKYLLKKEEEKKAEKVQQKKSLFSKYRTRNEHLKKENGIKMIPKAERGSAITPKSTKNTQPKKAMFFHSNGIETQQPKQYSNTRNTSKIQKKVLPSNQICIKKTANKKHKIRVKQLEKEDLQVTTKIKRVLMIGRPNVGKSTLYNKFLKKQTAITYNTPGVTRDVLEGICTLYKTPFIIMDCAGFDTNILSSINRIEYAAKQADIILFITEHDITDDDLVVANWIRKNITAPIILVVNKCDKKVNSEYINTMNFRHFIVISAEHNIGIIELCNVIEEICIESSSEENVNALQKSISIAILGRPNVGKSTFANNLLQSERMLVSPISGTTRDSVSALLKNDEGLFTIVDTAGIRRRAKVCDILETESAKKSFESIENADIIIFICDITLGELEKQDLLIANKIINNGKPFLILANKADQIPDVEKYIHSFKKQCSSYLGHDILIIPFSSLMDKDTTLVINHCLELWRISNTKIATSKLNSWLKEAIATHAHPFMATGKAVNFKYINQISTNPLKFLIHTNFANDISKNYKSYLKNHLSKSFSLSGVPIFLYFRTSSNPYYSKKTAK